MLGATGTAGGALATVLAAGGLFGGGPPPSPPKVRATVDGAVFDDWASEANDYWSEGAAGVEPECRWWNGSVTFTSDLCSHFSLSRMASNSAGRAIERAVRCAAWHETECVLSPEIGVSIPAAFVYDPEGSGMRMIIAPRVLPPVALKDLPPGATPLDVPDVRTVRVQDVTEKTNGRVLEFNHTLRAEFLPGGSRAPVSETFTGSDAYCVQLLRAAFSEECWSRLD